MLLLDSNLGSWHPQLPVVVMNDITENTNFLKKDVREG